MRLPHHSHHSAPIPAWTATAVSEAVREGSITAREATADSLSRIMSRNADIEAFQTIRERKALAEADAIDARSDRASLPLAGVPVAIKDNVPVEGESMTSGTQAGDLAQKTTDHEVVRRLRAAGAIVVGLTRTPELCVFGATDSVLGISHNPWNRALTPGGSSGGSAAAVASAMVPVAHGNDGMGSIRIPAACCGLVGIKPGLGLVPADLGATDWYSMSENGPLTTTVADAALLLSVMAGDPSIAELPEVGSLSIAVGTRSPVSGVSVDVEWKRATFETAGLLMRTGHRVERKEITIPQTAALAGLARWFAGTAADAEDTEISLLEARVQQHAAIGRRVRDTPLMSEKWRDGWRERAAKFLTTYDIFMTPTLAQPPIEARAWGQGSWAATMRANIQYAPFAAPWNVAGFPAMSVPAGVHPVSRTPMAVQLVARPGRESVLLAVAAQLEKARPWAHVAPDYR